MSELVLALEKAGYTLDVALDGAVLFAHAGGTTPDLDRIRGLLAELRTRKADVVEYLRERGRPATGDPTEANPFAHPPVPADPRPDLPGGEAWRRLLALAWPIDGQDPHGLYGALAGLRCCGAELALMDSKWVLRRGEMDDEAYAQARTQYLLPHADLLRSLLATLGP